MTTKKKMILVLEDEKPLMDIITAKLESEDFKVLATREVHKALDYLRSGQQIDLVWLDHYLYGEQSGLEFVTELKLDKVLRDVPIFVVSNTVSPNKVKLYLALGVKGFYTKVDFRLDKIVADIKKQLA